MSTLAPAQGRPGGRSSFASIAVGSDRADSRVARPHKLRVAGPTKGDYHGAATGRVNPDQHPQLGRLLPRISEAPSSVVTKTGLAGWGGKIRTYEIRRDILLHKRCSKRLTSTRARGACIPQRPSRREPSAILQDYQSKCSSGSHVTDACLANYVMMEMASEPSDHDECRLMLDSV